MIKSRGAKGKANVTFTVDPQVGARTAAVCGQWNDWSADADVMRRDAEGGFSLTVGLDAGRAYRFRYLLDGQRWDNDWAADAYQPNDFGGDDSVVDLTALAEAVPPAAKKQTAAKKEAPAKETAAKEEEEEAPQSPPGRPPRLRRDRPGGRRSSAGRSAGRRPAEQVSQRLRTKLLTGMAGPVRGLHCRPGVAAPRKLSGPRCARYLPPARTCDWPEGRRQCDPGAGAGSAGQMAPELAVLCCLLNGEGFIDRQGILG